MDYKFEQTDGRWRDIIYVFTRFIMINKNDTRVSDSIKKLSFADRPVLFIALNTMSGETDVGGCLLYGGWFVYTLLNNGAMVGVRMEV